MASAGEQDVSGFASGVMVFGGSQVVETGGTASSTTIFSGGLETVASSGTDDGRPWCATVLGDHDSPLAVLVVRRPQGAQGFDLHSVRIPGPH